MSGDYQPITIALPLSDRKRSKVIATPGLTPVVTDLKFNRNISAIASSFKSRSLGGFEVERIRMTHEPV